VVQYPSFTVFTI